MRINLIVAVLIGSFSFLITSLVINDVHANEKTLYVQAAKTQLKEQPQMSASNLMELERGDELEVLEKDGIWYQVSAAGKEGWISKLFVNTYRPVGKSDLIQDGSDDLSKASRRRSSSYSVAAATRGLSASDRVREGRELYRSDFLGLEKMETYNPGEEELERFQKSAKLK
jgi:hypothetical protein